MSEHQVIAFRAIDGPVSAANLEFMHEQSSRAEITPWSFDNEYHYGDFGGNAAEMLRRGYDLHLHYASFGIRKLMIRLPNGLPDARAAEPYFEEDAVFLVEDETGPGGILCVEPSLEPDDLEPLWDIDELVDRLKPLRAELLDGDLRPLYLARLAIQCDSNHDPEEETEAPVPAGLGDLTDAQRALAELYGLDDALLAALARESPPLPHRGTAAAGHAAWLKRQPAMKKNAWLAQLMASPDAGVRRAVLAEFRKSQKAGSWPTKRPNRTVADLYAASDEIAREMDQRNAEEAARQRAKALADLAADPERVLRETEVLVQQRSVDAYRQIASLLADLREALAGGPRADFAEKQARKLIKHHPTLARLTSELRKKGLLK